MTPSSVCVVLIQEYNLLCSLNYNRGLLETVEAGRELGDTLGTMTRLRYLLEVLFIQLTLYLHLCLLTSITIVVTTSHTSIYIFNYFLCFSLLDCRLM